MDLKDVMEVLSQLDPGCTKLMGRYMGLAVGAQARTPGNIQTSLARASIQAAKLRSNFSTTL